MRAWRCEARRALTLGGLTGQRIAARAGKRERAVGWSGPKTNHMKAIGSVLVQLELQLFCGQDHEAVVFRNAKCRLVCDEVKWKQTQLAMDNNLEEVYVRGQLQAVDCSDAAWAHKCRTDNCSVQIHAPAGNELGSRRRSTVKTAGQATIALKYLNCRVTSRESSMSRRRLCSQKTNTRNASVER